MTVPRRLALAAGLVVFTAATVAPVLAAEVDVAIVGTQFEPATITVSQGDTVTWTVEQSIGQPHSVTSGTVDDAGTLFDSGSSGLRNEGETYQHTFTEAGEFDYFCIVHPVQMTGKVVVLAPGQSAPPDTEPPPSEHETGIPVERRALAGGILVISILLMFAGAWLWRRMNPA
jgi:plastocyanin